MISLNYLLYDKSFDYKNNEKQESLLETIIRFNGMLEYIEKENKILSSTGEFYYFEVEKGKTFFDWLFEAEDTEKQLVRSFIEKLPTIDKDAYDKALSYLKNEKNCSYNALVCFFYCDNVFQNEQKIKTDRKKFLSDSKTTYRDNLFNILIRERREFNNAKKFYLNCSNSIKAFLENATDCLDNIYFGTDVEKNMSGAYTDNEFIGIHIEKVIYHLKILNEYGLEIINNNRNQGEKKICEIIQIKGRLTGGEIFDACSPEGDAEDSSRLNLPFKNTAYNSKNKEIIIRCSPHIKYYYANNHYRTYFGLPTEFIAQGNKIPVGSIGKHL
jgi:hypothetical protein